MTVRAKQRAVTSSLNYLCPVKLESLTNPQLNEAFDAEVAGNSPPPKGYVRVNPVPDYCGDLNVLRPFMQACRRIKSNWTGTEWWVDLDAPTFGDAVDKDFGRAFVIARIVAKRAEARGQPTRMATAPEPLAASPAPLTSVSEAEIQQAIDVFSEIRRVSASFLQRRLRIGYNRACRIIDEMEQRGLVGPEDSDGAREPLFLKKHS